MEEPIKIKSREYWVKIVDMLQQNWALVDEMPDGDYEICFVSDDSGVFDELVYSSINGAITGLKKNGFRKFADDKELQDFLVLPEPPFHRSEHPNGSIYSSSRFWK